MKITPDTELEHLKDEEYLIFRAKEEQVLNPFAAKSWLITAQIIYPQNFGIQFEIYKITKQEKNVREAANCLSTLFQNFPNEAALWVELDAIMSVLCESSSHNYHTPFISQIFYKLSKDTQKAIILSASERAKDTMTYVSLMLLLTSSFPENTAYNGLTLVDALWKAENTSTGPLNPFRRKLVCELLPRLLQAEGLEVRPKILHNLLTKSIEFYVAYSTTPLKVAQAKLDVDTVIEDPWQDLFSVIRLIGWNLGWTLASEFDVVSNRELILQKIQNMVERGARLGGPKGDNGEDVREVLYVTITIFLHALLDYTRRLCPDFTHGESSNTFPPPLTLVEAFVRPDRNEIMSPERLPAGPSKNLLSPPSSKRLRQSIEEEQSPALITVSCLSQSNTPISALQNDSVIGSPSHLSLGANSSQGSVSSGALSQALITAIKCWDILHAFESLSSEFVRILEGLSIEKWLIVFNMDILIYEGRLVEAENQLRHTLARARQSNQSNSSLTILTLNLKLASVLFALNKFSAATESALEVVDQLNPLSIHGGLTPNLVLLSRPLPPRRHLHLLALTQTQCLQFITTLLIYSLRHLVIVEGNTDDLCLGHLIVLLQFEWPRHIYIFEEVIEVIKKKGGFAYQYFAPYVTTADMLEEFMFLANSLGGGFQLDILPLPHTSKQQRMSTRGADRGSKQDFKCAMKKQMLRCCESVETNLISFLTRQRAYIPHVFM
ncbi:UNVERIFIED_CONTAM: hypothetical protein RMT77_003430 [Armadillidium vulgare]